ncbi:MAG: hypothetical protein ACT4PQ_14520 [Betaproteobacteria bacterium]
MSARPGSRHSAVGENPAALARLVQQGVKRHPYPKDVMAAVLKAANELYDEEAAANPVSRRSCQSWTVLHNAQSQWYRIAEAPFGNFMVGQRLPFK